MYVRIRLNGYLRATECAMVNDAVPSFEQLQTRTQEVFGVRPCLWQLKVVQAILQGDKDVVTIAGTGLGMGKTLTGHDSESSIKQQ